MADRTSARIFGRLFAMLAEEPDARSQALGRRVWMLAAEYDLSPNQMGCNEALFALGLARRHGFNPDYPDDPDTIAYIGDPGFPFPEGE